MSLITGGTQSISSITAFYENGSSSTIGIDTCNYTIIGEEDIITVEKGLITALKPGETLVRISYSEEGIQKYDSVHVTVEEAIPQVIAYPVIDDLEIVTTLEECSNTKWCFNQRGLLGHCPGGGICQADDTYAWDINLNYPVHNTDNGKPVLVVAEAIVAQTYGGCKNAGGFYEQVLIEHNYYGNTWWSGYLYLKDIQVTCGENVTEYTRIGYISDIGTDNEHLHFVVYQGQNTPGDLVSFDAEIALRNFSLIYFTITVSAGVNGSIDPIGNVEVDWGADQTFTITHKIDSVGSGVSINNGELIIENCDVSYNQHGRGIGIGDNGKLDIIESIISNNTFSYPWSHTRGGGISNADKLIISDSVLSNNHTYAGKGGGIINSNNCSLVMTGCEICDNHGNNGSGIYLVNFQYVNMGVTLFQRKILSVGITVLKVLLL